MKLTVVMTLFLISSMVKAQSELSSDFCKQYFSNKESTSVSHKATKTSPFNFTIKYIFNPKSLVKIKALNEEQLDTPGPNSHPSKKIVFNLLRDVQMNSHEKKEYKRLRKDFIKSKKLYRDEKIKESLARLTEFKDCVEYIDTPHISNLIKTTEETYRDYLPLSNKKSDELSYKLISESLKKFRQKGWEIFSGMGINQIHELISNNPKSTVVIIGHATPNGEVVDGNQNILPRSFFRNTQIENLVIYSCNPEEVASNYNVKDTKGINRYYYPQLASVTKGILDPSKIPLNSIHSILKTNFTSGNKSSLSQECIMESNLDNNVVSVFLNKTYLGSLKETIRFDCSLLEKKNYLEVYSISQNEFVAPLKLKTVNINGKEVELREFISNVNNQHVVTKGTF